MSSTAAASLPRAFAACAWLLAAVLCQPHQARCQTYLPAPLPRPDFIIVRDFSAAAEHVKLESGLGARATSILESQSTLDRKRAAIAAKVADAVAETLVQQI